MVRAEKNCIFSLGSPLDLFVSLYRFLETYFAHQRISLHQWNFDHARYSLDFEINSLVISYYVPDIECFIEECKASVDVADFADFCLFNEVLKRMSSNPLAVKCDYHLQVKV
jgi:hypothetical protein